MPNTDATISACQPSQRGLIRKRQLVAGLGTGGSPDMAESVVRTADPAGRRFPRVNAGASGPGRDNRSMSITALLRGRAGLAGRLPARLEDLHGPERGVIVLPRHLAWPGMREFDVTDDRLRRSLYGI